MLSLRRHRESTETSTRTPSHRPTSQAASGGRLRSETVRIAVNIAATYRVTIFAQDRRRWLAFRYRAWWGGIQRLAEVVNVTPAFSPGEHGNVLRLSRLLRVRHCCCVSALRMEKQTTAGGRGRRERGVCGRETKPRLGEKQSILIPSSLAKPSCFRVNGGWRGVSSDYSGSHGGWEGRLGPHIAGPIRALVRVHYFFR